MKTYTVAEFQAIKDAGFSYEISAKVINLIHKLADQVGSPEYVKTPAFDKPHVYSSAQSRSAPGAHGHGNKKPGFAGAGGGNKGHGKGKERTSEITDDDWSQVRNFQSTAMTKRDGIEGYVDNLRQLLNKLTHQNFDGMVEQITEIMDKVLRQVMGKGTKATPEQLTELKTVGATIFTIASSNSFYAEVYARLYKELMSKYEFMQQVFDGNFADVKALFNNFSYCDPNDNYDQFCENNKNNERRRALASFYVHLMKQEVLPAKEIAELILTLQQRLRDDTSKPDQRNIVEELSEVIFTMVVEGATTLSDDADEQFDAIKEEIERVSQLKPKAFPSLTNKTVFKHMDILDKLSKTEW
jgi:hypothetical protein